MPEIRPNTELRNNFDAIESLAIRTEKPVYITKNGAASLVVMSQKAFEKKSEDDETYLALREREMAEAYASNTIPHSEVMSKGRALLDSLPDNGDV